MSGVRRLAAAVVAMALLAGCASGPPDIAATTSSELQAAVQDIGAAAAAGHYAAAATLLDTLQARLDQAGGRTLNSSVDPAIRMSVEEGQSSKNQLEYQRENQPLRRPAATAR